jgi:hypothetical protein
MAKSYEMLFDIGTIKHLGLQMYSTLPPVIGELVSNAWDADAKRVDITIPTSQISESSEIVVQDTGLGMTEDEVRNAYLIVGRDRRKSEGSEQTGLKRPVMGRKGIGKFSAFGIANEIEIETTKDGQTTRFRMNYLELEKNAKQRRITLPSLPESGTLKKGTRVTLRQITKFRNRSIGIQTIRRGIARRFSVIGPDHKFEVVINGQEITPEERDLKKLLEKDSSGKPYLWEYHDVEIEPGTGWTVSGWIGALKHTNQLEDGILRGIVVMARGKLVQEPFVFEATTGQQFALAYLVGELHAEFVDATEDTISTTRNSLVWDSEANVAFKKWGHKEVNRVTREWSEKRKSDNEKELERNPLYLKFASEADKFEDRQIKKVADRFIRDVLRQDPLADPTKQENLIQMCLDFMEFDAFQGLAQELAAVELKDTGTLLNLFREWEIVEAKEMMRVTKGRITTIEKLQELIETNALEVPTLHNFLKEFPWVLDPRWTLVADEKTYTDLLRKEFPQDANETEDDRRIDFLCVKESNDLIVVEIKRPKSKVGTKALAQIEEYVAFMRDYAGKTTDPEVSHRKVVGYLLCGDLVNTYQVRQRTDNLKNNDIFVRKYTDLLAMVKSIHKEFLARYDRLRSARKKS